MVAAQQTLSQAPAANGEEPVEEQREKDAKTTFPAVDWATLVAQIKAGEDAGMEHLYKLFSRGIRYYLCRQLGPQELEDKVHDTFLIVVNAIKRGDLREPERLMGFVRTVVRRQVAAYIENAVHTRREQADLESGVTVADKTLNPEQARHWTREGRADEERPRSAFQTRSRYSSALLPQGAVAGADLPGYGSDRDSIQAAQIAG